MAAYSEIATHSAFDMFSKYKYLIVNLVIPPRFLEWENFLIVPFSDHCLLFHHGKLCVVCAFNYSPWPD